MGALNRVTAQTPEKTLETGRPWPLGSHWDGAGVNFGLFSAHAARVELCLFDGGQEYCLVLPGKTDQVWHGYLPGARPGLRYGYRVYGPEEGAACAAVPGNRFAPQHLLLDPYARELAGDRQLPQADSGTGDTAACALLNSRVADTTSFDWGNDAPPAIPLADSVIYEIHVKGATQTHDAS